ncbi:MAG: helix-turn-helix domain-containing protein [Verrucomicrobiales bacterium]
MRRPTSHSRRAPPEMAGPSGWRDLHRLAGSLVFERHDIQAELDASGRYDLRLPPEFPFRIRLFHYASSGFTPHVTWHEPMEIFLPLDGRVDMQMAGRLVHIAAGDVVIVENMKPHHVVDHPGFDTRVLVISFLPEFVCGPGALPHAYGYLMPFVTRIDGQHHVVSIDDPEADGIYRATARLVEAWHGPSGRRATGCLAWLLVLLDTLAWRFREAPSQREAFLKQQERAARLRPLLDRLHHRPSEGMGVATAARLTGMSEGRFRREFRLATGLGLTAYVAKVRLAGAAQRLKHSSLTIAEIAAEAGFSDQSYFDRCFKKAFGQTPRDFRQAR